MSKSEWLPLAVRSGVCCLLLAVLGLTAPVRADTVTEASPAAAVADTEPGATAEASAADSTAAEQAPAADADATIAEAPAAVPVDQDLEALKKSLLNLKRDLVILEEDLLFPASSQVAVFLSVDVGEFFDLDAVTLKLNGREVQHHLYTDKQIDALYRGAVQKLYVGNVKQGRNRVTAFFTGRGPAGRDYKRATTVEFEKTFEPTFIELAVTDSEARYQPEFSATVSE
ncbi:MAG: hypothetical protein AAGG11_11785 [Pseudomonadota bacterium]